MGNNNKKSDNDNNLNENEKDIGDRSRKVRRKQKEEKLRVELARGVVSREQGRRRGYRFCAECQQEISETYYFECRTCNENALTRSFFCSRCARIPNLAACRGHELDEHTTQIRRGKHGADGWQPSPGNE